MLNFRSHVVRDIHILLVYFLLMANEFQIDVENNFHLHLYHKRYLIINLVLLMIQDELIIQKHNNQDLLL
jgi:hypothetical protein